MISGGIFSTLKQENSISFYQRTHNVVSKQKVQGEWTQTVTSNLAMTDRKNVINFNLKGFSVQGRLGIYPWMIIMIISWPPLASLTSNLTSPIFHMNSVRQMSGLTKVIMLQKLNEGQF